MQGTGKIAAVLSFDPEKGLVAAVDKPLGWTSFNAVHKVKVALRKAGHKSVKVGHAGTLDPLATGVLLICLGRATKRVEELQNGEKEYVAEFTLGATTPSYDLEHPVDRTFPWEHITQDDVRSALDSLTGNILQVPPIYSAKMIDGRRAYDIARAGGEAEMRKSPVTISNMTIEKWDPPRVTVRIVCSKGTYVRSIARDLGEALGCGAHLSALCRTRSGEYRVGECTTLDELVGSLTVSEG